MQLLYWVRRLWRRWIDCEACENTGTVGFAAGAEWPCRCGRPCWVCDGYRVTSSGWVTRVACYRCTAAAVSAATAPTAAVKRHEG